MHWNGKVKLNDVMRGNSHQRTIRLPREAQLPEGEYNLAITDEQAGESMNMQSEYALNMQSDLKFMMDFFQKQGRLHATAEEKTRFRQIASKLGGSQ